MSAYLKEQSAFSEAMRRKLRANSHKRIGFISTDECLQRLAGEIVELTQAIAAGDKEEIVKEAADVANFAMFATLLTGALTVPKRKRIRGVP